MRPVTSSQALTGLLGRGIQNTGLQRVLPGPSAASSAQSSCPTGWQTGPQSWVKVLWGTSSCSFSGNETMDTESQASSVGDVSLSRASKIGWLGSFKYLKRLKTKSVISLLAALLLDVYSARSCLTQGCLPLLTTPETTYQMRTPLTSAVTLTGTQGPAQGTPYLGEKHVVTSCPWCRLGDRSSPSGSGILTFQRGRMRGLQVTPHGGKEGKVASVLLSPSTHQSLPSHNTHPAEK